MPSVEVKRRHYHSVNEEVLDVVLCEGRGLAGTRHAVECVLPQAGNILSHAAQPSSSSTVWGSATVRRALTSLLERSGSPGSSPHSVLRWTREPPVAVTLTNFTFLFYFNQPLFIQGRTLRAGSLFQWRPNYNIQIKTEKPMYNRYKQ